MRRALDLAERGWGRVAPNPMVGAVVVRDGRVVGEGYHAEFGGPHAEVAALRAAGADAAGATLYVNLEPCHHTGKTGPCSQEIVQAGVARVVCAQAETNPGARGGGVWLQEQGVEVELGVLQREARDLNAVHETMFERRRPFLALKYALSLDGRLSERPGAATRVTSGPAIQEAHRLRAGHDAVMVGIGTVLADDPQLTVRGSVQPRVPPLRVVVDSNLRTPRTSRLAETASDAGVQVFAADDVPDERAAVLEARGVTVTRVGRAPGGLDLGAVLASLGDAGIRSTLCEGGGRLGSAFLAAGLVDRLYLFIAPRIFGEPGVRGFQGDRGAAPGQWRTIRVRQLGSTTLLVMGPGDEPDPEDEHV
ncbi:MAG: bifunctional diaminohydroxyphosphoribosylaminopyrimidine deaminase/5-amino-6-(5-phosphoribosylamino)uracil reductase RibD [Gemmatimonadetes bacterium]|uniref:Riboflavin biosynthesis protein RibD n=1 Tax=Candidatus Kutchimonas denitrificans TaxID=3056748 RepID=A0AAE5CDF7_9BACT|nr:bifunctional diaminohydroxyphosphoribosylaminopyrimidine deaminase/5-amino-6-(5-phosphoribosylamino)uracil reductase RibD [Gemmatimonadota bacterium]NIR75689.1 bifunctional diaminohydroxyphosphoribosylaminopyrimidine deaminase/5-amino-6-(5-phosphoribosylamino)uracil reductase RibD [Candidatus Kutchimonas denitrificans]NIS00302.1 bifunctional diaminohydroxyphosphoribosylaminopyrimidine deaminase/5-amino-6-(5-phosphoribosylamino)uracil reductase RibD [Gemmatimonadota bacterium]NIT65961.1 bifunc